MHLIYLRSLQKKIYQEYKQETFSFSSKKLENHFQNYEQGKIMNQEIIIQNAAEMILMMPYSVERNTNFDEELENLKKYMVNYTLSL